MVSDTFYDTYWAYPLDFPTASCRPSPYRYLMPRPTRIVHAGIPHHVTQRGNRRGQVFFSNADYQTYRHWLREYSVRLDIAVIAYCLMTNHVHLILVAKAKSALPTLLKSLNARFARRVNRMKEWSGHLWQGRYFSSALDGPHFRAAVRYVERNPVRAGIVRRAEDYAWSSAFAHCGLGGDTVLTGDSRWLRHFSDITDWSAWLAEDDDHQALRTLRERAHTNSPCGSKKFIETLENEAGRVLRPRSRGRPRKNATDNGPGAVS